MPTSARDNNPYQSPTADDVPLAPGDPSDLEDPAVVPRFREQIHALGAYWIIAGLFGASATRVFFLASVGTPDVSWRYIFASITGLIALAWIVFGVLTCCKQMWAVYISLLLTYIAVAIQTIQLNWFVVVLLGVGILQAHRVIGWANKMRALNVPLSAKP